MRDPTVPSEATRVHDAVEAARNHLYWRLKSPWRWIDSRWSGQSPRKEREKGFYAAIEAVRQIINDPACDSLISKHAYPGARAAITTALGRARLQPPKKGEWRKQDNALRNQWIAEIVALTCRDGTFSPTRNKDPKAARNRRESGCSVVAQALRELGFKNLGEARVAAIWAKHKQTYRHLLPR
jgi:hypothetical protein